MTAFDIRFPALYICVSNSPSPRYTFKKSAYIVVVSVWENMINSIFKVESCNKFSCFYLHL